MIEKVELWATRFWRVAAGGLVLAVTVITLAQVFARYVLNDSIVWAEELNRLLFLWAIMIGAVGADHMRINLIADQPRWRLIAAALAAAASLAALALIAWGGSRLNAMFAFDRYTTLDLSKSWAFAAAIVGGGLWAGACVWRLWRPRRSDDIVVGGAERIDRSGAGSDTGGAAP